VEDNGSGIPKVRLEKSEGVGLESMRERAAQIDAKLEIHFLILLFSPLLPNTQIRPVHIVV